MKKLKNRLGESLAETLIAVLIASLAMMLLAGAITTAARMNTALRNEDVAFKKAQTPESGTVGVSLDGGSSVSVGVRTYVTNNGYRYYEYAD